MIKQYSVYTVFFIIIGLILIGCRKKKEINYNLAFYHWQQHFDFNNKKAAHLKTLNSNTVYLRFFDVDWHTMDKLAYPVSVMTVDNHSIKEPLNIIPTIFITNRVFKNIAEKKIDDLASQVVKKIDLIAQDLPYTSISAIQIDCDWSGKTQIPYFKFLETLKKLCHKKSWKLSTTIRLHQIKYAAKTGIPPSDRGLLMCYNIGDLSNWETNNSILNLESVKQYINKEIDYSLPLDIGLPIFHWGILFRDGRLIKLINELETTELDNNAHLKRLSTNRYEVINSTYLHGHYLYPNDLIRLEEVDQNTLTDVADHLRDKLPYCQKRDIVFYHLNDKSVDKHSYSQINEVFHMLIKSSKKTTKD